MTEELWDANSHGDMTTLVSSCQRWSQFNADLTLISQCQTGQVTRRKLMQAMTYQMLTSLQTSFPGRFRPVHTGCS